MPTELPPGFTSRPPAVDDAAAIWRFVAAVTETILGFADVTLDDIVDELQTPGFEPETDGWLVHGPGDEVVGYGWAFGKGDSGEIDVDVIAADDAVADWLWDRVIARAAAIAAATGRPEATVDVGVYRADERGGARAGARGFAPGTTFHRMRIDHEGPLAAPAVPDGVEVRVGADDPELRRVAHAVLNAAFESQFGFVPRSFEEWHEITDSSSTSDWSQLRVAYLDGAPAAMLLGSNQFVADERCGYVSRVGVLQSARGRGLARLLLRQAFAADAAAGRVGTILHVDTNNPTPALGLYERVGMRPVLVIDVWRRVIAPSRS